MEKRLKSSFLVKHMAKDFVHVAFNMGERRQWWSMHHSFPQVTRIILQTIKFHLLVLANLSVDLPQTYLGIFHCKLPPWFSPAGFWWTLLLDILALGPLKCFCAPNKRVIATKLNLRQNCINKVRTVIMLSIKNNKALKLVLFSCRVLWFAWLATKAHITTSQMCPLNQLCAPRHDGRDGKKSGPGILVCWGWNYLDPVKFCCSNNFLLKRVHRKGQLSMILCAEIL